MRTAPRLTRSTGFAAVTAMLVLFMAAAGAPTPLYVVYQQRWAFPTSTLTLVFAVYVLGLLATILVVGGLSDHVGRRPLLVAAIALEAVALVLFLTADGVATLLLARVAQGIATGAAVTTLSAALVDLTPPHAPGRAGVVTSVATLLGLAGGSVGTGALVEFAPAPTQLVYVVLLVGTVVAAVATALLPETAARRPGAVASLRPRVGLPAHMRAEFASITPVLLASWALGGLYLSLGPSVAAGLLGITDHLVGGLVATLLCGTGAVTALLMRGWPFPRVLLVASLLLAGGTLATLAAVDARSAVLAGLGTVVAGVGFGAAGLGAFGTMAALARPTERGAVFALTYVVSYLAFSLPAVVAGVAANVVGLGPTALVYGGVVVALSLLALAARLRLRTRQAEPV
ncbi:MAG TPA: MFS transporter [Pseudonocardia sp.]|nr:MFS transporter [Pseudonocardia sp.]